MTSTIRRKLGSSQCSADKWVIELRYTLIRKLEWRLLRCVVFGIPTERRCQKKKEGYWNWKYLARVHGRARRGMLDSLNLLANVTTALARGLSSAYSQPTARPLRSSSRRFGNMRRAETHEFWASRHKKGLGQEKCLHSLRNGEWSLQMDQRESLCKLAQVSF
jgi:hypothetical protein